MDNILTLLSWGDQGWGDEVVTGTLLTVSLAAATLPLGLVSLQGNLGTGSISVVLAGVVLSMIPAVAVFVVGQRPLREGITSAGVNR